MWIKNLRQYHLIGIGTVDSIVTVVSRDSKVSTKKHNSIDVEYFDSIAVSFTPLDSEDNRL